MGKKEISDKLIIYCDYERKIIERVPSQSNLSKIGLDNSLYFGMKTNNTITFVYLFNTKEE